MSRPILRAAVCTPPLPQSQNHTRCTSPQGRPLRVSALDCGRTCLDPALASPPTISLSARSQPLSGRQLGCPQARCPRASWVTLTPTPTITTNATPTSTTSRTQHCIGMPVVLPPPPPPCPQGPRGLHAIGAAWAVPLPAPQGLRLLGQPIRRERSARAGPGAGLGALPLPLPWGVAAPAIGGCCRGQALPVGPGPGVHGSCRCQE